MRLAFLAEGSPDCPLIRLYDFQPADVQRLDRIFDSLANGSRKELRLDQESFIEPIDGCRVRLRVGTCDAGIAQTRPSEFDCILTPGGWSNVAGLTEPFCAEVVPGTHQWLHKGGKVSVLLSPDGSW